MPSASPPPYDFDEPYEDYKPAISSVPPLPPSSSPLAPSPIVPLAPSQSAYPYHYEVQPEPQPLHSARRPQPQVSSSSSSGASAAQIDHLRNALSNLESRMALLLSEKDLLESRLETAVRLQSPVRRLPSELLASIFVMGVMNMEEDDTLMLSTLMLVCRHWLEVAVNTPVLWTRIVAGVHHSLSHAQRKLERSKALPLQICVDFSPRVENGAITTESIVRTVDLLRTSIWRWKTFRLTVPNRPQANAALMRCTDPAPLLEVFSVRVLHSMPEEHYHSNPPRRIFEGQAPSLTSCSLTSYNFGWDLRLVSRLRVLKLGGYWNGYSPSMDVTLSILRACPNLEELVLRNMSDVEVGACTTESDVPGFDEANERLVRVNDSRMINLPRLTKASFYYSGTLRTRTIFRLLTCPALEHVDLCFLDNVSPLIENLRRQSLTRLPLRHLRIEGCFLSELKLSRFLQRVPSLTSLELVDVEDVSSNLFKHLSAPPSAQTWICPKLKALSLEGCATLEWESLRSFVESRLPAHTRAFPGTLATPSSVAPVRPVVSTSSSSSSASASAAAYAASLASARSSASSTASSSNRPVTASKVVSSASAFAANAHILSHVPVTPQQKSSSNWPHRLQTIDLTRCHQISKEMVQWLRMYVADVKCDTAKGVWDDSSMV
ncbi:hypothetical protein BDY19DRAFT_892259 [Irpex rosettiformis]|uniref:Uncharacterized protein n=1 Tax=Irpex rosettiformis TaxID=378272 RepID=A0ACB8U0F6_9APHY|nr:hypothetical protein BDY19DRAFT_892259 [Irpex rosettiformis]